MDVNVSSFPKPLGLRSPSRKAKLAWKLHSWQWPEEMRVTSKLDKEPPCPGTAVSVGAGGGIVLSYSFIRPWLGISERHEERNCTASLTMSQTKKYSKMINKLNSFSRWACSHLSGPITEGCSHLQHMGVAVGGKQLPHYTLPKLLWATKSSISWWRKRH